MEENPKRRWLTFSLRTLLLAVMIFCVWLGWQWRIVRERELVRALIAERSGTVVDDDSDVFTDKDLIFVGLPDGARARLCQKCQICMELK